MNILKYTEKFTEKQKQQILKRDGYRCVMCVRGVKDSFELHVDHIQPKDKGGKATIENGQTLCKTHLFRKKFYRQTEIQKKIFINLYERAKSVHDFKNIKFYVELLEVFEKNGVNSDIKWKK